MYFSVSEFIFPGNDEYETFLTSAGAPFSDLRSLQPLQLIYSTSLGPPSNEVIFVSSQKNAPLMIYGHPSREVIFVFEQ